MIREFIRKNSFGLLLTHSDGEIHDTHTPFLIADDGTLFGHIARANPQGKQWEDGDQVKVVFSGPHAYISPGYYSSEFNVPTWNYTAVSITGTLSLIREEERILQFLNDLAAQNEPSIPPWQVPSDDERYQQLFSAIAVFSVVPEKVEASFKLNQNKCLEDQESVINSLSSTGSAMDLQVAELMKLKIDQSGNSN